MRPIDADALIQTLVTNGWLKMDTLEDSVEMIAVQAAIDAAPTLDHVLTTRGHWIDKLDYMGSRSGYKFCSICNGWMPCSSTDYKFCPNCGAKMDVGSNSVCSDEPLQITRSKLAKEYLRSCDNDCAGDESVGIPACPFYDFPDVDGPHMIVPERCKLKALLKREDSQYETN